ncbi:hypothetical protein MUN88_08365 [Gracilibacillus caseinilyticus]|uniref:ABC-2 family transporter protein n=1 Tax=Gracilibacillus caseinilyticus TaxID=2932256 RepID=A0ABY4F072_9BACI|nr:hypothetical protein [Gracilibacillus caseinilyticus]UOQ50061.1 hypothetical protein MUN88_08365 [Gracilibacillus caseinilyticus]
MKSKANLVGLAMYQTIATWMLWYLGVAVVIMIIAGIVAALGGGVQINLPVFEKYNTDWSIAYAVADTSRIFFLICGLLSMGGFIKYFVGNGVTRLAYFKGVIQSIVALVFTFSIIIIILSGIEYGIAAMTSYKEAVIMPASFYLKLLADILLYYVVGWFISAGFYSEKWVTGISFIVLAHPIVMVQSSVWGEKIKMPFYELLHLPDASAWLSLLISVIMIFVITGIIHTMTKNVRIKV